jgi:drug/metabolite transporter (DMT)-like permease
MYWPQTTGGWAAVIGLAIISTVVAMITFFIGLNKLGPTRASTLSTFEPVVSVALAALILGEPLTFGKLAGGALILSAVVLLTLKK